VGLKGSPVAIPGQERIEHALLAAGLRTHGEVHQESFSWAHACITHCTTCHGTSTLVRSTTFTRTEPSALTYAGTCATARRAACKLVEPPSGR
jgi:hypothetical protein